jgi:hypothetical protein
MGAAAAERWLDRLPEQDKDALRHQLLEGERGAAQQRGDPW